MTKIDLKIKIMNYKKLLLYILLSLVVLSSCITKLDERDNGGPPISMGPTAASPEENLSPPRVEVHFYYYKDGEKRELLDGETLHSGDKYRIEFTPLENCYVQVYQVDSKGNNRELTSYAEKEIYNKKLKAKEKYYLPSLKEAFFLDKNLGTEIIYFVAYRNEKSSENGFEKKLPQIIKSSGGVGAIDYDIDCTQECIKKVKFKHIN